jgi:pyrroline-5-carboxylate reductase
MKPTVAILGAGSMGETFGLGLLRAGWETSDLAIADRRHERIREVEFLTGITATLDAAQAVAGKRVIVVAVKPKDVPALLEQIRETLAADQVIVSIAAGVTIASYEKELPDIPIVRSMPNTPAAIDEGMTAYCGGTHADTEAIEDAAAVLGAVGDTIELSEDLLDAVTAVSGTGPAYAFLLAEAMTEAAIREGLPHYAAERLVHQTLRGAGMLLAGSDKSAFRLRSDVTSPGGTTAAAMYALEEGGFRTLIEDAIRAAARRSRELGRRAAGDSDG